MTNPFVQNGALLPLASLNKLPLASLNKLPLAGAGKTAQQLCQASVLAGHMQRSLAACGLPTQYDWLAQFAALRDDPRTAACAATGVAACADGLAALLLTLKRPGMHRQSGAWTPAHWAFWDQVDEIVLGGGLMGGAFGAALLDAVRARLADAPTLTAAAYAPVCALLGAAKYASRAGTPALVFDFGHSYWKQGWLTGTDGGFVLRVARAVPAVHVEQATDSPAAARALADALTGTIVRLYRQVQAAGGTPGIQIAASIANYVQADGCVAVRGGYGKLALLGEPLAQYLGRAVSDAVGHAVAVQLIHDGMAGACAVQGSVLRPQAFIGLGTSLAVGFPTPETAFDFPCQVETLP